MAEATRPVIHVHQLPEKTNINVLDWMVIEDNEDTWKAKVGIFYDYIDNKVKELEAEMQTLIDETRDATAEMTQAYDKYMQDLTNLEHTIIELKSTLIIGEEIRVLAENQRTAAEDARLANELTRVAAETERLLKESERLAAEAIRVSNEAERVDSETDRVDEWERLKAEIQAAIDGIGGEDKSNAYPVNAIYESSDPAANPAIATGVGTWERISSFGYDVVDSETSEQLSIMQTYRWRRIS